MESVKDIEKQIADSEAQLYKTRTKIKETQARLIAAEKKRSDIQESLQAKKTQRQDLLAQGQDSTVLSSDIRKLTDQAEIAEAETEGLKKWLPTLQSEEASLSTRPGGLRLRLLQIESVELAQKYNELSGQLAEVAKGLNGVHFKIDSSGNQGKAQRVVFLPTDYIENIPRAFYDADALTLESYVARFPGKYHSNILCPACERNFYLWSEHRADLIKNR